MATLRIAVDAMGGDFAPNVPVEGAVMAYRNGIDVVLVGKEKVVKRLLEKHGLPDIEVFDAPEIVGMDESAVTPLRKKRNSSLMVAAKLVKEGVAGAMLTAGNTGAAMAASLAVLKTARGIKRPALVALFPNKSGSWTALLDVGANVNAKPEVLFQFAIMGSYFVNEVLEIDNPRIGVLSIGEEKGKGNEVIRKAYKILSESSLNFVGNVEGGDIFTGKVDVIVCDGFVGNVVLKACESLASFIIGMLKDEIKRKTITKLGAFLAKPAFETLYYRTDPNTYGAVPLLGINGGCFIAHGASSAKGIANGIKVARSFLERKVLDKIIARLSETNVERVE